MADNSFSALNKYLMCIVGAPTGEDYPQDTFTFDGREFQLAIDCNLQVLLNDINLLNEFGLESDNGHLGLFFYARCAQDLQSNKHYLSRRRLVNQFLSLKPQGGQNEIVRGEASDQEDDYELLYERLRQTRDRFPRLIPEDVQHKSLKPLLREYQRDAVSFMIHRERIPDSIPAAYDELTLKLAPDTPAEFFWNAVTGEFTDIRPSDVPLPTGGILADEMGLGKTVEILALILNNPSTISKSQIPSQSIPERKIQSKDKLRCMCTRGSLTKLIMCAKCQYYQHINCVMKNRIETSLETTANYICPKCWSKEAPVESGATIIVSPFAIGKQWEKEISKHISDPNFRVLIYSGVSRFGWISPLDLAQYDVVITDYNVLRPEIYFTATDRKDGVLRHEKRHLSNFSPLPMVKWWRVCLDEAQMVETPTNQCTRMVKTLSTVHRWAVTGTPIEKSINNLHGLLFFLDCLPYNEFTVWSRLAQPFIAHGNSDPLVEGVLKNIMWRTCKRHVVEQLGIPPQTHRCHKIIMSDVQTIFYRDQHEQCRMAFQEQVDKMERWGWLEGGTILNPQRIRILLEPLRKLRQDCTVPSVLVKGDQLASKRLLSPDELYSHLLTNNEMEAKSELRSIVSSLNGLAGIAMLVSDFALAEKYYKSVLARAAENTGPITVDSLLQIHALDNLITTMRRQGREKDGELEKYAERLKVLEVKYTDNYYQVMNAAELQLNTVTEMIDLKPGQSLGHWWRVLLARHKQSRTTEEQLLLKINIDVRSNNFANYSHEDFRTADGIDYVLTLWWDAVIEHRSRVREAIKGLRYFTENIRPGYKATSQEKSRIDQLIVAASECHLTKTKEEDNEDDDDQDEPLPKIKRKVLCELCQAKLVLIEYECKIFDKTFNEERQEGEGTWKPSHQEWIIRHLLMALKRDSVEAGEIREADNFAQLVDKLKAEYKELSKFWVEINYTASAYDELNMCKLQLNVIDPELLKKGEKMKRNEISVHTIELTKDQFQIELNNAELEFMKSTRNLSYLKHLSSNPEVHPCPICDLKPVDKYSVWDCGHQMCIQCLLKMKKYNGVNLNCPVCRNLQSFRDINFVTVVNRGGKAHVSGKYSAKIIRIVEEVQGLLKEEKTVKIIIFSQWDVNLTVIQKALEENKITARLKSNKPQEVIEEFKSADVTCLLLPLSWGSKGLNLIEATHVFLVEPILNPSEELQAVGRVHRIGQTRPTVVHRFIVEQTVEETIYNTVSNDLTGKWKCREITVENVKKLFQLNSSGE